MLLLVGNEEDDAGTDRLDLLGEKSCEIWSIWRRDSDILWLNSCNFGGDRLDMVQLVTLWNRAFVDLIDLLLSWEHQRLDFSRESALQSILVWEFIVILHLLDELLSFQHVGVLSANVALGLLSLMLLTELSYGPQ